MPDEPPIASKAKVLSYATPGDDGLPEFMPEVEELLAQRASVNDIRPFFHKTPLALTYFVKSLSRRFSRQMLGERCCLCSSPAGQYCVVTWSASVKPLFREMILSDSLLKSSFGTCHCICETCYVRSREPFRSWNLVWVLGWLLCFGSMVSLCSGVWVKALAEMDVPERHIEEFIVFGVLFAIGLGMTMIAIASNRRCPVAIRSLLPRNLKFLGFEGIYPLGSRHAGK